MSVLTFMMLVLLSACGNSEASKRKDRASDRVAAGQHEAHKQTSPSHDKEQNMVARTASLSALPTCSQLRAEYSGKANTEALLAAFNTDYPATLVNEATVEGVSISEPEMERLTAYLACVADLTDYFPEVADGALALYASKRHGAAAFHALQQHAKNSGIDGKAAQQFLEQMQHYVEGPGA